MNPNLKNRIEKGYVRFGISKQELETVSEETLTFVDEQLVSFINDFDTKELSFPSTFSNIDRKLIHTLARDHGLKSKSKGVEPNRFVTVFKGENFKASQKLMKLKPQSLDLIDDLLATASLTESELNLDPLPSSSTTEDRTCQLGRAKLRQPVTDVKRTKGFRDVLPIKPYEQEILHAIEEGRVTLVIGETGSGKTTQVPQMIMENAERHGQKCQIICSMPRRVAAISICDRVAFERGEQVGPTVGYQIRLDSRTSTQTILTYCTNGVLLRSLLTGDKWLENVSHIIIDEVHERDKLTDFSLIVLKDALAKYKHLKLILMSATIDSEKFQTYFKDCPYTNDECKVVKVPGKLYEVKEIYLEHVLQGTDYMSPEMRKLKEEKEMEGGQRSLANAPVLTLDEQLALIDLNVRSEMDDILDIALNGGTAEGLKNLIDFMNVNKIPVDYQHPECGRTALMAAAIHSDIDAVDDIIHMDPDLSIQSKLGKTALEYAQEAGDTDILEWFDAYKNYCEQKNATAASAPVSDSDISPEVQEIVDIYEKCHIMKDIDENLIFCVLKTIHDDGREGAVLIFLPGYDHIMCVKDKILDNISAFKKRPLDLHILHSRMKTTDQKKVFDPAPAGRRKVILSTNIAETSITINDVRFVIDCGKIKELNYNSLNGAYTLECDWISQSCAEQRKGRAGRTCEGVCFRLFSKKRYDSLKQFKVPELLREPIAELCLQAKQLAPTGTSIADFLGKAIDPPLPNVTRNTINLLKQIEALTPNEDLTVLGRHLLNIPIDPYFGKMIVYAIILRCLDPVLTIACCLSGGELFKLPSNPELKARITQKRLDLSRNSLSDHLVYLNAFREWEEAVRQGKEKKWCLDNFISLQAMDVVVSAKSQILNNLKLTGADNARKLNQNSENWAAVKAALTAGLYPNLAKVDKKRKCLRTLNDLSTVLHASSVLKSGGGGRANVREPVTSLPSEWLLYQESHVVRGSKNLRTCTVVSPATVCIFAGPTTIPEPTKVDPEDKGGFEPSTLQIDQFLQFPVSGDTAMYLRGLRNHCYSFVKKSMNSLGQIKPNEVDDKVLSTIMNVLTIEDEPQMNTNPMEKELSYEGHIFVQPPRVPGIRRVPVPPGRDFRSVRIEDLPPSFIHGRGKALLKLFEPQQALNSNKGAGDSQTMGRGRGEDGPRTLETATTPSYNDPTTAQDRFADAIESSGAGAGRGSEPSRRDPQHQQQHSALPAAGGHGRGRGRGWLISYFQSQSVQPNNVQGAGRGYPPPEPSRRDLQPQQYQQHQQLVHPQPQQQPVHPGARGRGRVVAGAKRSWLWSRAPQSQESSQVFQQSSLEPSQPTPRPSQHTDHERPSQHTDHGRPSQHTDHGRPSQHTDHGWPSQHTDHGRPSQHTDHGQGASRGNVSHDSLDSNKDLDFDEQRFIKYLLEKFRSGDERALEILLEYGTFDREGKYRKGYELKRGYLVPMKDGNPRKNMVLPIRGKAKKNKKGNMRGGTHQQQGHAQYQPANHEPEEKEEPRETLLSAEQIQFIKDRRKKASEVKTAPKEDRGESETPSPSLPQVLAHKPFRFFLIKRGTLSMVKESFSEGVWFVTKETEERLRQAKQKTDHMFILLWVTSSEDLKNTKNCKLHLQGHGKLVRPSGPDAIMHCLPGDLVSPWCVQWRVKDTLVLDRSSFEDSQTIINTPDGGELSEVLANTLFAIWNTQYMNRTGERRSFF